MSLTRIGSIGINTGIAFAGVTTIVTLNTANDALSIGATVNVGSGITLGASGDGFYTGVVTATTFSGSLAASSLTGALPAISGANLTNLDASDLASGTVPTARLGSGTASSSTFLRGDSTFAAVTSTTINNNADNRLITGSGTANTLEGEANLTYNGGTILTQKLNDNTAYSATATTQMGFQAHNQSNTTNSYSAIRLTAGSSSPATAQISSLYTGAGQNDLTFQLETSNTAFEAMRITSAGNVGIKTDDPQSDLHILDTIPRIILEDSDSGKYLTRWWQSGNATVFDIDSANTGGGSHLQVKVGGSEKLRIDSSGRLLVGTTVTSSNQSGALNVFGTDGNTAYVSIRRGSANASGPRLALCKSRNTTDGAASGLVSNNDILGTIHFYGNDSQGFEEGAAIAAAIDGTPGSNDLPTRLTFSTTPDGSDTKVERMRITSEGRMGVKTTSPDATLHVGGIIDSHPVMILEGGTGSTGDLAVPAAENLQVGHWDSSSNTYTNRFQINTSTGNVTMPSQACMVFVDPVDQNSVNNSANLDPIHFNTQHINQGGVSSSNTKSRITVPTAGTYLVQGLLSGSLGTPSAGDGIQIKVKRNGSSYPNDQMWPAEGMGPSAGREYAFSFSVPMTLAASDYVELCFDNIGSSIVFNNHYGYFAVTLIH